mgnify:FL=1
MFMIMRMDRTSDFPMVAEEPECRNRAGQRIDRRFSKAVEDY